MGIIERLFQEARVQVLPLSTMTVTRLPQDDVHVTVATIDGPVRLCLPVQVWEPLARILAGHRAQVLQNQVLTRLVAEPVGGAFLHLQGTAERRVAEDRDYEVMRCRMPDRLEVALSAMAPAYRTPAMCALHDDWAYVDAELYRCYPNDGSAALSIVQQYRVQSTVNSWGRS
jgi:hypothetical protein